ncbi:hypothetical protein KDH_00170 [Dictyobacter sp. S3.2.2.5]|uniref:Uncharacterized protein n=1 Tax=Dictyobacter halimunensis TaxID=3026934 RepID=A0ABQ6FGT9_9CHLR|nr:hypothetical protein KDH_00170 [Dictyobacter sp. S3.2.2.5]
MRGGGRESERDEIPTLVRAFLAVEAVSGYAPWRIATGLEIEQVSQKYGRRGSMRRWTAAR